MKTGSKRMTSQLVKQIYALLATGKYHQHQIAAMLGVNQGRISETKNGLYDWMIRDGKQPTLF